MKLVPRTIQYITREFGSDELIIIDIELTDEEHDRIMNVEGAYFGCLREVSEAIKQYLYENTYPYSTGSPYDCSGRPFGSYVRKLDFQDTDNCGFVALYYHSYSIDL